MRALGITGGCFQGKELVGGVTKRVREESRTIGRDKKGKEGQNPSTNSVITPLMGEGEKRWRKRTRNIVDDRGSPRKGTLRKGKTSTNPLSFSGPGVGGKRTKKSQGNNSNLESNLRLTRVEGKKRPYERVMGGKRE